MAKSKKSTKTPRKTHTASSRANRVKSAPKKLTQTANKLSAKVPKKISLKVSRQRLQAVKRFVFTLLLALIVLGIVDYAVQFIQYRQNKDVIVTVNGDKITRQDLDDRLELAYGQQVAENLIQEKLIAQEAEKQGVEVSTQVIDQKYKELVDQFGGEDALKKAMEEQHISESFLREQLRNQELLSQLVEKNITVDDKELQDFFDQYKDSISTLDASKPLDEQRDAVVAEYKNFKMATQAPVYLMELENKANIDNRVDQVLGGDSAHHFRPYKKSAQVVRNLWDKIKSIRK